MAVGDGAHGKHDPHFPVEQIFKTPAERELLKPDIVDRLRVRVFGKTVVEERNEAADEIERLRAIIVSDTHVLLSKRPVAWRVMDHPDCWMLFQDEAEAYAIAGDRLMQGLYTRDGK